MAETNPYKERDKNVVISNGVRYTKADADRLEVKPDAVRNKARTTSSGSGGSGDGAGAGAGS